MQTDESIGAVQVTVVFTSFYFDARSLVTSKGILRYIIDYGRTMEWDTVAEHRRSLRQIFIVHHILGRAKMYSSTTISAHRMTHLFGGEHYIRGPVPTTHQCRS